MLCSGRYSLLICVLTALTISAIVLFVTSSLFSNFSMTDGGYFEGADTTINLRGNATNSKMIGSEPEVTAFEKSTKNNPGYFEGDDDYYDDSNKGNEESITLDNSNYNVSDMSAENNDIDFKSKEEKISNVELEDENEFEEVENNPYDYSNVDLVNQSEESVIIDDENDAIEEISIDGHNSTLDESSTLLVHDSVTLADGKMYELVGDQLYHDKTHFIQGLTYSRSSGILFESNGLYRKSQVCQLNATTGVTIKCQGMGQEYFAEGMQVYGEAENEKLIQITWQENTGFIYDAITLNVIKDFQFTSTKNEGWGICLDENNHEFIVSDGSQYLHFWDVDTLEEKRKIAVTRQTGSPARKLNELEFMNGKVLANVWYEDVLLVIDPDTGRCESEYDFSSLWPENLRKVKSADALNGISISDEADVIYMTGKLWDRMFKVRLN